MATALATPTYSLGALVLNATDSTGCIWGVSSTVGWDDGPGVRLNQTPMPRYDGLFRAQSYRAGRTITIQGWVQAPNRLAMQAARDQLQGLFAGGGQVTLTVADDNITRTAAVELADVPKVGMAGPLDFDYQLVLSAADPRKYNSASASGSTSLASAVSGLDWATGGGLDWTGGATGGLVWGTVTSNGTFTLVNPGTAEAWPTFTATGTAQNVAITNQATGQQLGFNGTLGVSDTLTIATSPYAGRSVLLNGNTDRRNLLIVAQWFPIPPGGSVTCAFTTSNAGDTGTCAGSFYPAYW